MLNVDFSPMVDDVWEKCPNYTTTFYKERTGMQKQFASSSESRTSQSLQTRQIILC